MSEDKENKSELGGEIRNLGVSPSLQSELGSRISLISDVLGSRKAAAKAGGVSEVMIYRYIKGEVDPPLAVAVGLARASGYSLQWIILGEGPMKTGPQVTDERATYTPSASASVDLERLEEAIRKVEQFLEERSVTRPPEVRAQLIAYFYDRSLRKELVEKNDLVGLLDLIY